MENFSNYIFLASDIIGKKYEMDTYTLDEIMELYRKSDPGPVQDYLLKVLCYSIKANVGDQMEYDQEGAKTLIVRIN